MAAAEEWVRGAMERLSEDEALRGDLSDQGFGPLLDWGMAAVQACAAKVTEAGAGEKYADRIRDVIREAVQAAEAGKVEEPGALLLEGAAPKEETARALKGLRLGEDPDANAVQIAAVLQEALKPAPPTKAEEAAVAARPGSPPAAGPCLPSAARTRKRKCRWWHRVKIFFKRGCRRKKPGPAAGGVGHDRPNPRRGSNPHLARQTIRGGDSDGRRRRWAVAGGSMTRPTSP
jgi:hypothetical protein